MTIASEIQRIQTNIANAYDTAKAKGATLPAVENTENLASTIESIEAHTDPVLQDKTITENGVYTADEGYTGLGTVTVDVSSSGEQFIPRELVDGVLKYPTTKFAWELPDVTRVENNIFRSAFKECWFITSVNFPALTTVNYYGFEQACENCNSLKSVNFPALTTIKTAGFREAFYNCSSLTSINFPALTTVDAHSLYNAFYGCSRLTEVNFPALTTTDVSSFYNTFSSCSSLTSVSFPELTTIKGAYGLQYCFNQCKKLTSVSFPKLATLSGNYSLQSCFSNCTALTSVNFPALTTLSASSCMAYCFSYCSSLTDVYFPALTTSSFGSNKDQMSGLLSSTGTTVTHTLHFPSNLETIISGLTEYPIFGGTASAVQILFDLAATS